ncbi:MAG TPA: sulfite exporter TauE/SafE family protein [Methanomicrobia archaeon]|nr:sulfite exporter TauE/SafE family protein [Methanomicrobia archaeon]
MELLIALIILAVTGIAVGFGEGLLGIGGSFIMVPVVYWLLTAMDVTSDTAIKLAFGSALLVVFPTAISGTWIHTRKRAVWWKAALVMGLFGSLGALTGSTITAQFLTAAILKPLFGIVLAIGGIQMVIGKLHGAEAGEEEAELKTRPLAWALTGLSVGLLSGLIGIGGGTIMVPALVMGLKFKLHHAIGTSLAVIIFTSCSGALGYLLNGLAVLELPPYSVGYLNLFIFACLAVTSIPVAQLGARTAHIVPARELRYLFAAVMFYIAFRMIYSSTPLLLPF